MENVAIGLSLLNFGSYFQCLDEINVLQIEINWKFSMMIDSISIPILNLTVNHCGFHRFDFSYRTNDHATIP